MDKYLGKSPENYVKCGGGGVKYNPVPDIIWWHLHNNLEMIVL